MVSRLPLGAVHFAEIDAAPNPEEDPMERDKNQDSTRNPDRKDATPLQDLPERDLKSTEEENVKGGDGSTRRQEVADL